MELRLALRGDLAPWLRANGEAVAPAVTSVIRRKTNLLKKRLRRHVEQAGLGERLAKTIRGATQPPRGNSVQTAGLVFSAAIYKQRPGGPIDLIDVFNTGATVSAKTAKGLFVGGRLRGKGGQRYARVQTVPVPKLLDIEPIYEKTVADLDTQILLEWDRRVEKAAAKFGSAA